MKRLNSIDLLYQNLKIYKLQQKENISLNHSNCKYNKVKHLKSPHIFKIFTTQKLLKIKILNKKMIAYSLNSLYIYYTKMGFEPIPILTHHKNTDLNYRALLKLGRISFNDPYL